VLHTVYSSINTDWFSPRYDMCCRHVSVCLSVCLSVTSQCSLKTAKHRSHKQRLSTQLLRRQTYLRNSNRVTSNKDVKYRLDRLTMLTCQLTAWTLGSAAGPTLSNEYGKPFRLKSAIFHQLECVLSWIIWRTWFVDQLAGDWRFINSLFWNAICNFDLCSLCMWFVLVFLTALFICEINYI